jgi:hypothetical protein
MGFESVVLASRSPSKAYVLNRVSSVWDTFPLPLGDEAAF